MNSWIKYFYYQFCFEICVFCGIAIFTPSSLLLRFLQSLDLTRSIKKCNIIPVPMPFACPLVTSLLI